MSDAERFSRQERLAEVGAAGQDRISGSTAMVGGEGADVERAYLLGAGVGHVAERVEAFPFEHGRAFEFDGARAVGAGAWRALTHLRVTIGIEAG